MTDMRILLVEDDQMIGEVVLDTLRAEQWAVDWVKDGEMAETALATGDYDLVLLDLGLPKKDGLQVLRDLRAKQMRVPVLVATARDAVSDQVAGLDAGADDYIVKPYDLAEIEARLRANARRASGDPATESRLGGLRVDRAGARLFKDETEIRLTSREWALFDALLSARGRVLSKQVLEDRLYAFDDAIEGNAVEVYVSRLRGKLGADAIQTRRGLGYLIP